MSAGVYLRAVSKSFGPKAVLRGFDLECPPGVHLLLGPNGSGKSTVLNLAAGLLQPDEGRVEVEGLSFLVPAETPHLPWLRADELLDFAASLYPTDRGRAVRNGIVERLGITGFLGKRLSELSSGTARKIVIASALCAAPPVLLFDEPTNELDEASVAAFISMMGELRGHTLIIATHQAARFASLRPTHHLLQPA